MKSIKLLLPVLFILLAFMACHKKNNKEIEADYLSNYVDKLKLSDNTKWVVILPGLGCPGCIQEGEQFMKDNVKNKNIYFVLTTLQSAKVLQYKIGAKISGSPNICVDKDNEIHIPTNHNIYPCIVKVEKGHFVDHEFQSPEDGLAFYNLKSRLQTQ